MVHMYSLPGGTGWIFPHSSRVLILQEVPNEYYYSSLHHHPLTAGYYYMDSGSSWTLSILIRVNIVDEAALAQVKIPWFGVP